MTYTPADKTESSNLPRNQESRASVNSHFNDSRSSAVAQRAMQQQIHNSLIVQIKSIQLVEEDPEQELEPTQLVLDSSAADAPPARSINNTGLSDNLKSGIESLSGMSMDHVRVHFNSDKPAQLNAHAYAQGSDIHVAPGQEKHLPHEAWHIVQQAQGRVKPTMQMKGNVPVNDDAGLEHEADIMGAKALEGDGAKDNYSLGDPHQDVQLVASNDSSVIQPKLAVQIIPNIDENNIDHLQVGGRAGSLWSKERHHTTPWQSYVDHLNGQLAGLTIIEASEKMITIADDMESLPGWELVYKLEDKKLDKFLPQWYELNTLSGKLREMLDQNSLEFLGLVLQQQINSYINVRTQMPLAQSDSGGGAGTVGPNTTTVKTANTGEDVDQNKLRHALMNMFDFATLPEDDDEDAYANLGLSELDDISQEDLRKMMFRQHAMSMQATYPVAFDKAFTDVDTMIGEMGEFDQSTDVGIGANIMEESEGSVED